jgi:hypothetical protein
VSRRCRRPSALAAVVAAVVLGGCGSGSGPQVISAGAAAQMRGHLAELRTSAAARDPAGATRQLDAFAADVGRAHAAGRLRPADYAALQTAIARTRARIAAEVIAPAPVTAPSVTAAPSVVPGPSASAPAAHPTAPGPAGPGAGQARGHAKQDHGKGHGKGKGG